MSPRRHDPTRPSQRTECLWGLLFAAPGVALLVAARWWSGWASDAAYAGVFVWAAALVVIGLRDERSFWRDLADDGEPPRDPP
jgi:hypothetical protein